MFLRGVRTNERNVQQNIAGLNRAFASQCPKVGMGAPQDEAAQKMSYEVAGALWWTLYRTDAAIVRRFVRAVRPLSWSKPAITRIARTYIKSLAQLASLPRPDLCGDVRAWSASDFGAIPDSTIQFDRHLESIEGKPIPMRLLAPYVSPADRGLASRTARLEVVLEHAETIVGFADWDTLLETLALNQ